MEHLTDVGAGVEELGPCPADVVYHQLQALGGAGRGRSDPAPEDDRARRAGGRHLDHAEPRVAGEVGILAPPEPLVEALCPVHVGHRDHDDLEPHVHDFRSLCLIFVVPAVPLGLAPLSTLMPRPGKVQTLAAMARNSWRACAEYSADPRLTSLARP